MEAIQFSGLNALNDDEKEILNQVCSGCYDKVKMLLHKEQTAVNVNIKTFRQKGDKKKYSVTLRAIAPATPSFRSSSYNWILANALHEAFDKLEHEIRRELKK
ncbi:hypothetical protein HY636_02495 [Candidatus Woesearchaeota archaeon]|nr:hypothetical protein [Candidatus Woesearchaeota archaeon]